MKARVLLIAVGVAAVAAGLVPAHAAPTYRLYTVQGVDGSLGGGGTRADVLSAVAATGKTGTVGGDTNDVPSTFACVVFHKGAASQHACGELDSVTVDPTLASATVQGTLPADGGGTITVDFTVTADGGTGQLVPFEDTCDPPGDVCIVLNALLVRAGTTSGTITSSTLGSVSAGGTGDIARGADAEIYTS